MLCFAFGMNLDPASMQHRGCHEVGPAKLRDWKLVFYGLANIEPSPGAVVYGALWELDADGLAYIDQREGYIEGREHNLYDRLIVTCDNGDEQVQALVYTMGGQTDRKYPYAPGIYYLSMILQGYRHFGLPEDVLWATVKDHCLDEGQFVALRAATEKEVVQYA